MIKKVIQLLFILALIALIGYVLYEARTILLYFVVSAVVALIGRPLFKLLIKVRVRNRNMGESAAAFITMLVMLTMLSGIIGVFLPLIIKEATLLTQIDMVQVREAFRPGLEWLSKISALAGNKEEVTDLKILEYGFQSLDVGMIPKVINSTLGAFGNFLIAVFSVAFMTFFLLKERDVISFLILSVTPRSKEEEVNRVLSNMRHTLSRYFLGLLLQVTAITTCVLIGLSIFGVKNALLIAFFTGVANLIPYLGPWIGALFGLFIILANNLDMGWAETIRPQLYGLLITVGATQLLDNYLFQPLIFSNSINAHPLEVFIVILIAGTLGGVVGLIAAVPTYAVIRIASIELNRELRILDRIKER